MSGPAPFGFRREGGRLVPEQAEATVRREMFELFLQHRRVKTVARKLNEAGQRTRRGSLFSDTTVMRLLQDSSAVDGIVTRETWDRCQTLLADRGKSTRNASRVPSHPLGGLVECHCGGRMYLRGRGPKGRFVCRLCQAKIPAETLEQVFRDSFRAADGPYRDEAYRIFENWPSFDDATKRQLVDRLVASVRIGVDEVLVNLAINPGFFIETGPEKGNMLPSEHGFKGGGTRP